MNFSQICDFFSKSGELFLNPWTFYSKLMNVLNSQIFSKIDELFNNLKYFIKIDELFSNLWFFNSKIDEHFL